MSNSTVSGSPPLVQFSIGDSTTSLGLNSTTDGPINRTSLFSVNDARVYSWVNFTNVLSPNHNVTFAWLTPQKALYFNASTTLPDPGNGSYWQYYVLYDDIFVAGHSPANNTGTWEVDIYLDSVKLWTQTFTINSTVPARLQIADAAISQEFNSTSHEPLNRTLYIAPNETAVYSWIRFTNVPSPSHNVTWVWLTPQKTEYFNSTAVIPDPGAGQLWIAYNTWDSIFINGHSAASLPGLWEVDVYVDGSRVLIQTFSMTS